MLHFMGFILLVIGAVMTVPAMVAPVFGESYLIPAFVVPAVLAFFLGFLIRRRTKPSELTLGKAMVITTVAWLIFSGFSSVPYVFGNGMSVEDAYFESMSGLTATGLTMISGDTISENLVISEVGLTASGVSYVELYNPTAAAVNIADLYGGTLYLWIAGPSPDAPPPENLTLVNSVVPAHGYYLIADNSQVDNFAADALMGTKLGPSGAVIIDDDDSFVGALDQVAWGGENVENFAEGVRISFTLVNGSSIERKALSLSKSGDMRDRDLRTGNGFDTDNNSYDFVTHQASNQPQNTASNPEIPIRNVEATDRTILFWRSFTEWVGGIGVIVLFLAALVGFGKAARKMYVAEARTEFIEPNIRQTVRSIWKVYVLLTVLGIILIFVAGWPNMSLFEAVNHSMTGIATGGFSVRNTSFATYSVPVFLVTILIMVLGATSFAVHVRLLKGNWREFFNNVEVKLMLILVLITTLLMFWSVGLEHALFQSSSALTGTGFSSANLAEWGDPQKGILTMLMVIGGGYGSTSSAIKLIRLLILGKAIHWMIRRSFLPDRAVLPMKIVGKTYAEREMMETAIYALIYILVLLVGAAVLVTIGNGPMDSIFESASAQGNVGLSVGITSTFMPFVGKLVLIIQMLVGRLEILPVIAFISYFVAKIPRPSRKPF